MCKCTSKPWTEQRNGSWVARDMDGYTMRVSQKKGSWRWNLRPPGGGYDVYSGTEADRESAQQRAEKAYQGLHEEIHKSNEARRGTSNT
jgi:hypothetical protein